MISKRSFAAGLAALALAFGATVLSAAPGGWAVEKVGASAGNYDTSLLFGNTFTVGITLKYTPGSGNLVEPPMLDWHEKFIMVDYGAKQRWVFEHNMYDLNPNSNTLVIWNMRYICAYEDAVKPNLKACEFVKGASKLRTLKDVPVPAKTLGAAKTQTAEADAVRSYLKKSGGYLQITISDIPSLGVPKTTEHRDRLLLFDCGVVGGVLRAKGYQHVMVDGSEPKTKWVREAKTQEPTVKDLALPNGFKNVEAPEGVKSQRDKTVCPGGCYM